MSNDALTASVDKAFLSGDKVSLRGLRRSDLDLYRSWLENPDATHYMESGWRPMADAEMEAIYQSSVVANDSAVFVMVDRASGEAVGICGLYLIQWVCRRAEFRILIGNDQARNRGLGSEAAKLVVDYGFNKLNLETISLGVNTENKRAIASYEKAGFRPEGVRRKLIFRNGRYYDALMMSILREEHLSAEQDTR